MDISFLYLRQAYEKAQEIQDIEGQAACISEILQRDFLYNEDGENDAVRKFLTLHFDVVFLAMMECIEQHRGKQAQYYLQLLPKECYKKLSMLPSYHYWMGRAFYEQGRWLEAAMEFSYRIQENPNDELANYFLGNCYIHMGKSMRAVMAYQRAVTINNQFIEAINNRDAVLDGMKQPFWVDKYNHKKKVMWELGHSDILPYVKNEADIFSIPIFINSRDRVEPLRKLVSWLLNAGYHNIHILDNESTYTPLLLYYDLILKQGVNVWPLNVNFGHKSLWESNILNILQIDTPYVYTDSDVVPDDDCPKDILLIMAKILSRHLYLKKVGLSLHIDDITYYNSDFIRRVEGGMKHILLEDGYFQSTDTTFALYRNWRHYSLRESVRTVDRFMGRHIPWYYDYDNLPADELYYMEHANSSSTQTFFWKNRKIKENDT